MAEFIFRHLCEQAGIENRFHIASMAVSTEETGNDIYPPAKETLRRHGIPFDRHYARQIDREAFERYDLIICADRSNIRTIERMFGTSPKLTLMMHWAGEDRDVSVKFVGARAESAVPVSARYIRIEVETLGNCPDWHYGVGYPAWFFMDEVVVE